MGRNGIREGYPLLWLGSALTLISGVVLALHLTALPVVLNVSLISLGPACLAVVVFLIAWIHSPQTQRSASALRAVLVVGLAAATGFAVIACYLNFISFAKEDLTFENGSVQLAGSLYLPRAEGPHPAVVIVHGSGPESRREYSYYARRFARAGIAALAYDKRGVGESSGELYQSDYHDYSADIVAAMQAVQARSDIADDKIGLVGFSEAEWTAPLAAVRAGNVAFVSIIGASGMTPAQQVNAEISIRLRSRGYSEETINQALELNNRVLEYQRTGQGGEVLKKSLSEAIMQPWFRDAGDIPSDIYPIEDYGWWRSVMDFDPGPVWERVSAPVLLFKGSRDAHSEPEYAQRAITAALRRGGNRQVDFILVPGADHMLLKWPLGQRVPPPMFADSYLEHLIKWMKARFEASQQGAVTEIAKKGG